jgi:murein DD-endopeptidase MepM/ murein hydrolase activator NlpD
LKSAKIQLRDPIYRYNAETCRYERCSTSWLKIAVYSFAVLLTSLCFLAGILFLDNLFTDTKEEIALQKENLVLKKSEVTLGRELSQLQYTLAAITAKDVSLHEKFFGNAPTAPEVASPADGSILLADAVSAETFLNSLEKKSAALLQQTSSANNAINNTLFSTFSPGTIPTELPLDDMSVASLASGFGQRINPFHKALYSHEGIDLIAARGTPVHVTASGEVITVKYSSIEAGFGNYVEVDHKNGFITRYAHLEDILVSKGTTIESGSVLGTTGKTGGAVAPHLHYEVILHGKNVDPVSYLISKISPEGFDQFRIAGNKQNQSLD